MKKFASLAVIAIITMMAGNAFAGLGLMSFAPRVAYVMPEDLDATIGFGAVVGLGELSPSFGLELTADYWKSNIEESDDWEVKDFILGLRARYDIATEGNMKPYLFGGLGMNFMSVDFTYVDFLGNHYDESDSESKIGFDLGGGLDFPGESMSFFAEAAYRIVEDFSSLWLGGGVKFNMGN
ncbi:MAG: outer membrane protein [Candidatus Krumholzibacteriia bacterium]